MRSHVIHLQQSHLFRSLSYDEYPPSSRIQFREKWLDLLLILVGSVLAYYLNPGLVE